MRCFTISSKLLPHIETTDRQGVRYVPLGDVLGPVHRDLPEPIERADISNGYVPILIPETNPRMADDALVYLACPLRDHKDYRVWYKMGQSVEIFRRGDLWEGSKCSRFYLVRMSKGDHIVRHVNWAGRKTGKVMMVYNGETFILKGI